MEYILSIIIPVYNGASTIKKCIDSILSLNLSDIQVCIVDDGSTDDTEQIIRDNYSINEEVFLFHSNHNGVSHARNLGIQSSKGKYISFVDCDDCINAEGYIELYNFLYNTNVDLVCGNYLFITMGNEKIIKREYLSVGDNLKDSIYDELLTGRFNNVWSSVYRSDIIKNNRLYFDESMKMGEDAAFNIQFSLVCNDIVYLNSLIYNYNANVKNSATNQYKFEYLKDYICLFDNYRKIVDLSSNKRLLVDRNYYIYQLYKCISNSNRGQLRSLFNEFKDSWLYEQIIEFHYSSFKSCIFKIYIIFKLLTLSIPI